MPPPSLFSLSPGDVYKRQIDRCAARVQTLLGEDAAVGVAHGRMTQEAIDDVMSRMTDGELNVLVCTTIIETGIDLPNANTLIIENADQLGLAQLHQIRGRVGRSSRRAFAYLTYRRGKVLTEVAAKRLEAIREFAEFGSGFKIAMRDQMCIRDRNSQAIFHEFEEKDRFLAAFAPFIHRDWIGRVFRNTREEFDAFADAHPHCILKPRTESGGEGVELCTITPENREQVWQRLVKEDYIAESLLTQCDEMASLHPGSVNTVRALTIKGKLVSAVLRMGVGGAFVDCLLYTSVPIKAPVAGISCGLIQDDDGSFQTLSLIHILVISASLATAGSRAGRSGSKGARAA